jgi:23S rRNA (cytosine1962-C5)-methyltransferase
MDSPAGQTVKLKKAIRRLLGEGHPWVFRHALEHPRIEPGRIVTVTDAKGRFVARGIADAGPIAVRVLTTREEPINATLFARRIEAAAGLRDRVLPRETDTYRLLHGEGDRLPGVVCDLYASYAVLGFDGEGIARWQDTLTGLLEEVLRARGVSHLLVRSGRGERRQVEAVFGKLPQKPVGVIERGMKLMVDLVHGQKTGLFIDQRESRWRVRGMAAGLSVLNLYGYTGGFSVATGLGGAEHVETVDVAAPALDLAGQNWKLNGLDPNKHIVYASDVSAFLERAARRAAEYDLVIADPPSFAPNEKSVRGALAAYRNLHRAAIDRVAPGGYYLAASCSSHVKADAFEETVREGARRTRRVVQILERWGAPPDHPRLLAFPEGDYLKVLLARIVS